jgi:hypothetical protein
VEKRAGKVAFYNTSGIRLSEVKRRHFPSRDSWSQDRPPPLLADNVSFGCLTLESVLIPCRSSTPWRAGKAGVIDLGIYHRPHGIAMLPNGQLVVTIENPNGLLLIDPVARKVLRKYEVRGDHPHKVLLGPKTASAWASNANSREVAVVDLAS